MKYASTNHQSQQKFKKKFVPYQEFVIKKVKALNQTALTLLDRIIWWCKYKKRAFPSQRRLGKEVGRKRWTVNRIVKLLRDSGLIVAQRWNRFALLDYGIPPVMRSKSVIGALCELLPELRGLWDESWDGSSNFVTPQCPTRSKEYEELESQYDFEDDDCDDLSEKSHTIYYIQNNYLKDRPDQTRPIVNIYYMATDEMETILGRRVSDETRNWLTRALGLRPCSEDDEA